MTPIFRAIIQKGKVVFDNVDKFNEYLIPLEDKDVDVIVRKHRKGPLAKKNLPKGAMIVPITIPTVMVFGQPVMGQGMTIQNTVITVRK